MTITEQPDYDLSKLKDNFTECGDYTKEVILDELEYWKKNTKDFLCLISSSADGVDGFLIAYRNRNSLWVSQVWYKTTTGMSGRGEVFELVKTWSRKRGMTSITFETIRKQMKVMEKYGFKEYSLNMRMVL